MTSEHVIRDEIPVTLWQRTPPLARDRQDTMTREQIAGAAFELAESGGGLSSTSVKRVAHRLGLPASRLEQYLPDRNDLLDLMLDSALGEIVLSEQSEALGWRDRMQAMACSLRALVLRHPWLVELIGGRPPSGPNGLRFMEDSLTTLTRSDVPVVEAAQAVNAVHAFVCGSVQMHVLRTSSTTQAGAGTADYLRSAVLDPGLPILAELFAAPSGLGSAESFEYGLTCLLDGMSLRWPEQPAVIGA